MFQTEQTDTWSDDLPVRSGHPLNPDKQKEIQPVCEESLHAVSYTHLDVYKRQVLFCTIKNGWGWDGFMDETNAGEGIKFPAALRAYVTWFLPILIAFIYLDVYKRQ